MPMQVTRPIIPVYIDLKLITAPEQSQWPAPTSLRWLQRKAAEALLDGMTQAMAGCQCARSPTKAKSPTQPGP